MTNLTVWQTLTIAMIPAVITAINSWGMKFFEISKDKNTPKTVPDATSEAQDKKSRKRRAVITLVLSCIAAFISVVCLLGLLQLPSNHQNLVTLLIAYNVGIIFVQLRNIIYWNIDREKWQIAHDAAVILDKNERDIKDMKQEILEISEELRKHHNKGKSN